MSISKERLCQLIDSLAENQTERHCLDAKVVIHFKKPGDKAYFIKIIAAMANNAEKSYILMGIEDKTWNKVGINDFDHLLDPDGFERQMNQLLQNKIYPFITLKYIIHEIDSKKIGVITIDASQGPYIIGDDLGGDRTRDKPFWVRKGQLFFRHGTTTKIVNRKEELLRLIEKFNPKKPKWYDKYYEDLDPEGDIFYEKEEHKSLIICVNPIEQAYKATESWVLFSFVPKQEMNINLPDLHTMFKQGERPGKGERFRRITRQLSNMLYNSKASPACLRAKDEIYISGNKPGSIANLFIRNSGIIEFNLISPIYFIEKGNRYFSFVNLVGLLWQLIYFSKAIYESEEYLDDVMIILKMINTKGTTLQIYAKGWCDAFKYHPPDFSRVTQVCEDKHIELERKIALGNADDQLIEEEVKIVAKLIGEYYGCDTPKCFERSTGEFPWGDFIRKNSS